MARGALLIGIALLAGCSIAPWQEAEYVHYSQSEDVGEETSFEASIKFATGEITIGPSDPSRLYSLDLNYDANRVKPTVDFTRRNSKAILQFSLSGEAGSMGSLRGSQLTLLLNPNIPLQLGARAGVGRSQIDL